MLTALGPKQKGPQSVCEHPTSLEYNNPSNEPQNLETNLCEPVAATMPVAAGWLGVLLCARGAWQYGPHSLSILVCVFDTISLHTSFTDACQSKIGLILPDCSIMADTMDQRVLVRWNSCRGGYHTCQSAVSLLHGLCGPMRGCLFEGKRITGSGAGTQSGELLASSPSC